jgi:hypothetical protein
MQMFENLEARQLMSGTLGQWFNAQLAVSRPALADTNRDGKNDWGGYDRNRDGKYDLIIQDRNRNGRYDAAWVDANCDGKFETTFWSYADTGLFDRVMLDTNRDGVADTTYADIHLNGTFSQRESTNRVDNNLGLQPIRRNNTTTATQSTKAAAHSFDLFSDVQIRESQGSQATTPGPRGP